MDWAGLTLAGAAGGAENFSPESLGRGMWMVLGLALLALVLVCMSAVVFALRRGRRMRADAGRRRASARLDAWSEAGKRAEPADLGEFDAPHQ